MQSNHQEVVSVHVQDAIVNVESKQNHFDDPFKDVSNTFKAGFFTGVAASGLLLASISWLFI